MTFSPKDLDPYRSTRNFYGAELRRCRECEEWSLTDASSKLNVSKSTLARLETAETPPQEGFSQIADRVYKTGGHFTRLYELVKLDIHPDQYRRRMEIEARACVIAEYAGLIVPGLLQTEAYARVFFRAGNPQASEEEIQKLLDARLSRQELLRSENPPDYSVILDEAAIRRPFGGSAAMRAQLGLLIEQVERPNGVIQVLPFEHGEHALLGGTLTLLTLPDSTTVAYDEGISTGTLLEDRERVTAHQRTYDLLRSYALSPPDTAVFIRSVMEALPT